MTIDIEYIDDISDETPPVVAEVVKPRISHAEDLRVDLSDPLRRYGCACVCGRRYLSRDPAAARRELGRHLVELRGQHVMEVQTR